MGKHAKLVVEQCDREAAAIAAAHEHGTFRFCELMRAGEYDDHHLVQAFARHRIEAIAKVTPA